MKDKALCGKPIAYTGRYF